MVKMLSLLPPGAEKFIQVVYELGEANGRKEAEERLRVSGGAEKAGRTSVPVHREDDDESRLPPPGVR
jgi:hypothetical protein